MFEGTFIVEGTFNSRQQFGADPHRPSMQFRQAAAGFPFTLVENLGRV
jgi:hypothetical protein